MPNIINAKGRSSNIELLRIISMLLIVAHHYVIHGGFSFGDSMTYNKIIVEILSLGGKMGVNLFVLISGYFLSTNEKFRWKSIVSYLFQVTFFSVVINGASIIFGGTPFSIKSIIATFFPLFFDDWWFAKTYFVLVLLAPFVSIFINNVSKQMHQAILIVLFIIWCLLPTFLAVQFESSNLGWFIFLFILSAYIRKYPDDLLPKTKHCVVAFALSTACLIFSVVVLNLMGIKYHFLLTRSTYFAAIVMLPVVIQSVSFFCLMKNMNIKNSKAINGIAASMFGVYLIHESDVLQKLFWVDIFKNSQYQNSPLLIVHALLAVLAVFVICTCASFLYNILIGNNLKKYLNKNEAKYQKFVQEKIIKIKGFLKIPG